ncbi:MAG: SDR family NAD(P)-dependent oxidoreductase, partial [Alphaproteobacteria bacterium]
MASRLFSLDGRVALVSGASRGLGLARARAMAEHGAKVVLNGRDAATLEAAAARLRAEGLDADTIAFDVADHAASVAGIDAVARRHGRLDALVCNAGIQHRKPLPEWQMADWERVVSVNLSSCFAMAFSNELTKGGAIPTALSIKADVTLGPDPAGGFKLTGIKLT